ncbi:YbhB/YbcL family Raf kinase inhibitor-like protein [Shewanella sp. NKUCC05_KAH]|uniref:YbhB/YbcL family Raf kinase inhibitor-like protein n=1 Tax=Shewanella sp. NKUCC05_KAH TaxID=2842126 RepID=UPI001C5B3A05|nr:YbhB/YbcL family Raf kinase inhibitor-like protein [Shewanella sp. NKUCC05_KAH]MBW3527173.1 YbhB/YbcL family Raf kinase inhibitor-like protein [Shewanella sp. NKUCC05_KAH]
MNKGWLGTSLVLGLFVGQASAMTLTSKDMSEGNKLTSQLVFNGFGCQGENISPQLTWTEVPTGTKAFAVTAYDPDAPTGSGWWHWAVYNLPVAQTSLAQGAGSHVDALPKGAIALKNDFGTTNFGGACPPQGHGVHRYEFTVWALPSALELPKDASPALLGFMLRAQALGNAKLTAVYNR